MSTFKIILLFVIVILAFQLSIVVPAYAHNVSYDARALIINGQRKIILSGAIHYPRSTVEMWPDLIRKAKEGGIDTIETYVFWDRHEPKQRTYDFTGNLDIIKFLREVQKAGLHAILRIGPYVCAEWTYGGFPMWLHNIPGIELRTNNDVYKDEMKIFTTKIVNLMKGAKMFASEGGPIILAQIENEYGNIMDKYGEAGKSYIKWCAQMAVAQNIGVPWIMCQQADAPSPMINTCNGYYCHDFTPNNPKSPKMWTENWVGWFKTWGAADPHRTAQDTAFSVARFFQSGGILNSYYMYHGGTNFGRTAGGPYITTSYDYDAPLNEYGNLNQPKWGHLKDLHQSLKVGERILTNSGPAATTKNVSNGVQLTTYTCTNTGEKFCFLSNINTTQDANVDLQVDGKYFVPAWSVSILQNCNKEIYNTAKIKVQTSLIVKEKIGSNSITGWSWLPEHYPNVSGGAQLLKSNEPLDQKTAEDASDYLWYLTTANIDDLAAWKKATLRVQTSGHVLHAFVNEQLVGSQWGIGGNYSFLFEKHVSNLRKGLNHVALLSVTVGFANYGARFDLTPTGIANGSVQLVREGNVTLDLTSNEWTHKIGLLGEAEKYNDPKSHQGKLGKWGEGTIPKGRPFTWYRASFEPPSGTDPLVVDLSGMGKGHAWVNGNSIGRYWAAFKAKGNCTNTCDYRGKYYAEKCLTNCGNATQTHYHVPRSFLVDGNNKLVLFEELGGDPTGVNLRRVTARVIGECPSGQSIS